MIIVMTVVSSLLGVAPGLPGQGYVYDSVEHCDQDAYYYLHSMPQAEAMELKYICKPGGIPSQAISPDFINSHIRGFR